MASLVLFGIQRRLADFGDVLVDVGAWGKPVFGLLNQCVSCHLTRLYFEFSVRLVVYVLFFAYRKRLHKFLCIKGS